MKILQIGCNDGNDHVYKYVVSNKDKIEKLILLDANPKSINLCKNRYREYNFCEFISKAIIDEYHTSISIFLPSNEDSSEHCSVYREHLLKHEHKNENIIEVIVESQNINSFLEEHKLYNLDRLYIDTEGLDVKILNAIHMDRFNINNICFEYVHSDGAHSHGGENLNRCLKKLQNYGYSITQDGYNLIATKI